MTAQPVNVRCRCGAVVVLEPEIATIASHGVVCSDCLAAEGTAEARRRLAEAVARQRDFSRYCPPCFADTDPARLPCQRQSASALSWSYGPRGLNLWGWPRTGKTRTASVILAAALTVGRNILALGPGAFRQGCELRAWRRGAWLSRLANVDLLYLDDIDKVNLTREMEKDFFAMLNDRMGHKPVIVSGNADGETLITRFRSGDAIVGRIREFCTSIYFPKP